MLELYYANKARRDEIRRKDREELTEEEKDFLAKYEADRAKDNERKSELYYANKARRDEIRRKDREELTEEEEDFLAKCEAALAKDNKRKSEWRRVDIAEYNAMRDDEMQSLLLNPDHQKQQLRIKRKAILQVRRICRPKMLKVDLVLNVSPGRL